VRSKSEVQKRAGAPYGCFLLCAAAAAAAAAAMPLVTTTEGPSAAMLYSDEGAAQRTESAVESRVVDQPRRQSAARLSRTNTGDETAGTAIDSEFRNTATLV
jgi:hypothetical protein